jgi:hypothetical protein
MSFRSLRSEPEVGRETSGIRGKKYVYYLALF